MICISIFIYIFCKLTFLLQMNECKTFYIYFYSLMKYPILIQRRQHKTLQTNKEARLRTMKKFNILTNWITTWHHLLLPQFQTPNKVLHEQNQTIQTMEKEKEKTTLRNNNLTLINHSNHHPMLLPHYPQMLLTRTKTNLKIRCWNCWAKCQRRMQWMLVIFWSMINDQENEKLYNVKRIE